jgi:hypothetical protein
VIPLSNYPTVSPWTDQTKSRPNGTIVKRIARAPRRYRICHPVLVNRRHPITSCTIIPNESTAHSSIKKTIFRRTKLEVTTVAYVLVYNEGNTTTATSATRRCSSEYNLRCGLDEETDVRGCFILFEIPPFLFCCEKKIKMKRCNS